MRLKRWPLNTWSMPHHRNMRNPTQNIFGGKLSLSLGTGISVLTAPQTHWRLNYREDQIRHLIGETEKSLQTRGTTNPLSKRNLQTRGTTNPLSQRDLQRRGTKALQRRGSPQRWRTTNSSLEKSPQRTR